MERLFTTHSTAAHNISCLTVHQVMPFLEILFPDEYRKCSNVCFYFIEKNALKRDNEILFQPVFIEFNSVVFHKYADMDKFFNKFGEGMVMKYKINSDFYHSLKNSTLNRLFVEKEPVMKYARKFFHYRVELVEHISEEVIEKIMSSKFNHPIPTEESRNEELLEILHLN